MVERGGRWGPLETEKLRKKSSNTSKPQEISSKSEIKALTNKARLGTLQNLPFCYLIFTRLRRTHPGLKSIPMSDSHQVNRFLVPRVSQLETNSTIKGLRKQF